MYKSELKKKALAEIDRRANEIIEYATAIWKYPELGYKEFKTAELTEQKYEAMGWRYEKEIAITGSKAYLKDDGSHPSIGIVGELDALHIPV
ncbi:MAG: amidohydrolase, partial [Candidatus Bathyarchaeota archaeon]|nr:amidohydrolase [Candidatus Bathyarchaeota archaeon]